MDSFASDPLVQSVTAYVKEYMSNYDASHSWDHIERVIGLARHIYTHSAPEFKATLDPRTIQLAALLHDVGDRKYLKPNESATTLITTILTTHGATPALAAVVQTICQGVSYSSEVKDPSRVSVLIETHPELAVVQDADRLDAIGAVGLARMFTYGGAKTSRSMKESMDHLDEKLVRLEGMTKTAVGRQLARERTERLLVFKGWWGEESGFAEGAGAE